MYKQFSCVALFFIFNIFTLHSNPKIFNLPKEEQSSPIMALSLAQNHYTIFSVALDGSVRIWNSNKASMKQSLKLPFADRLTDDDEEEHPLQLISVLCTLEEIICGLSNGLVISYKVTREGKNISLERFYDRQLPQHNLTSAALSTKNDFLFASSDNGRVIIHFDNQPVKSFVSPPITTLAYSPNKGLVACIVNNKELFIFPTNPAKKGSLNYCPHVMITAICWIDDDRLACAFANKNIHIWEKTGKNFFKPDFQLEEKILAFALSPDQSTLTAGSDKGTVYLIDVNHKYKTTKLVAGPKEQIRVLSWSNEGNKIAAGTNKGNIFLWEFASESRPRRPSTVTPNFVRKLSGVLLAPPDLDAAGIPQPSPYQRRRGQTIT